MKNDLDKKLCEKYPKIFVNRNKPMNETCMCWGFDHGDGWYNIIDSMCSAMTYTYQTSIEVDALRAIAWNLEPTKWGDGEVKYYLDVQGPQVIADQVKEKFGTLRFYFHLEFEPRFRELAYGENPLPAAKECAERYSSYIDGIVHYAECLTERTCEETGKEGEMHVSGNRNGWYRTLNREHAKTLDRNFIPVTDLPKEDDPL